MLLWLQHGGSFFSSGRGGAAQDWENKLLNRFSRNLMIMRRLIQVERESARSYLMQRIPDVAFIVADGFGIGRLSHGVLFLPETTIVVAVQNLQLQTSVARRA